MVDTDVTEEALRALCDRQGWTLTKYKDGCYGAKQQEEGRPSANEGDLGKVRRRIRCNARNVSQAEGDS